VSTEEPMSIEDRVRTATRAGATLVRDIGPMAAGHEKVRFRRRPAPAARRWGSWGIPLAAAAAVVLVAVSLVAVRQFGASAPATGGPATNGSATTVPRYYVDIDASDVAYTGIGPVILGGDALIVGDDVTGKAIATVEPPPGLHFNSVQGATDDRTFVVMASRRIASVAEAGDSPGPDTLYLLRIAPGTAHPYQLAKLPIKLPGSAVVLAYALSPNDRELAVESQNGYGGSAIRLAIYSVSSSTELRAWTTNKQAQGPGFQPTLSWLSDGRQLAFSNMPLGGGGQKDQMRTIDVTGPGTDLLAASHVVLTITNRPPNSSTCWGMNLTPDGGTATCATQYGYATGSPSNAGCSNGGLEVTAYSARTGRPVRVLYKFQGACSDGLAAVLWTDSSARSIIGATETDLPGITNTPHAGQLGLITAGHLRPLKLAKAVSLKDYLMIAF
jgi:hypothetical protein